MILKCLTFSVAAETAHHKCSLRYYDDRQWLGEFIMVKEVKKTKIKNGALALLVRLHLVQLLACCFLRCAVIEVHCSSALCLSHF